MPLTFSHEASLIIDPFRPPQNLDANAYAAQSQRQLDIVSDTRSGQDAIESMRAAVNNTSSGATSDALNVRFNAQVRELDDQAQTHTMFGQTLANAGTNLANWDANLDALGADYDAQNVELAAHAAADPVVESMYPLLKQALDTLTMSRAMAIGQGGSAAHQAYTGNITALGAGGTSPELTGLYPLAPGMVPGMGTLPGSYLSLPGAYQPVATGPTAMTSASTGTIAGFINALFNNDPLTAAREGLGVLGKAVTYATGASQYLGAGAMDILGVSPGVGMGAGIDPALAGSLGTAGLWDPNTPMAAQGTPYDPLVQSGMYSPTGQLTGANPFAMMGSQMFNPMNFAPYGQQPGMLPGSGAQAPRGVPSFLTAGMDPRLAQTMQQGGSLPPNYQPMMGAALGGSYGVDNGFVPGAQSSTLAPGATPASELGKPMVATGNASFTPTGGRGFEVSGELSVSRGEGNPGAPAPANAPATAPASADAPANADAPASANADAPATDPANADAPADAPADAGEADAPAEAPTETTAAAPAEAPDPAPAPEPAPEPAGDGLRAGGTNPETGATADTPAPAASPTTVQTETTSAAPAEKGNTAAPSAPAPSAPATAGGSSPSAPASASRTPPPSSPASTTSSSRPSAAVTRSSSPACSRSSVSSAPPARAATRRRAPRSRSRPATPRR